MAVLRWERLRRAWRQRFPSPWGRRKTWGRGQREGREVVMRVERERGGKVVDEYGQSSVDSGTTADSFKKKWKFKRDYTNSSRIKKAVQEGSKLQCMKKICKQLTI
jgi:hypothetical protein